jgi:hypothetical protein
LTDLSLRGELHEQSNISVDAPGGRLYGLQRRGLENDSQDDLNLNRGKENKQEKRSGPRSLRANNPLACGLSTCFGQSSEDRTAKEQDGIFQSLFKSLDAV